MSESTSTYETEITAMKDSILQNITQVAGTAATTQRQVCYDNLKEIGDALGITDYTKPVPNVR